MYKYLQNIEERYVEAVVCTEGRICVMADSWAIKHDLLLRHYVFMLDYMHIPAERILFICLQNQMYVSLKKKMRERYSHLKINIQYISDVKQSKYDYVLIGEAQGLDSFSHKIVNEFCLNTNNVFLHINSKLLSEKTNIDLALLLDGLSIDYVFQGRGYKIKDFLSDSKNRLEREKIKREKQRQKKEAFAAKLKLMEEERKKEKAEANSLLAMLILPLCKYITDVDKVKRRSGNTYYSRIEQHIIWYRENWPFLSTEFKKRFDFFTMFHVNYLAMPNEMALCLNEAMSKNDCVFSDGIIKTFMSIIQCHKYCPSETKLLLRNLFMEKDSFAFRMMIFRSQSRQLLEIIKNRYSSGDVDMRFPNNSNAIITLMALVNPTKHYAVNVSSFLRFCSLTGIQPPSTEDLETEYEKMESICDGVRSALMLDEGLLDIYQATLNDNITNWNFLTSEFINTIGG